MKRMFASYNHTGAESERVRSLRQTVYAIVISVLVLSVTATLAYIGLVFHFFRDSVSYIVAKQPTGPDVIDVPPIEDTTAEPPATDSDTTPVVPAIDYHVYGRPIVICVDAGHGYDDPGAESDLLGGLSERDITLDLAKMVRGILTDAGYEVIMTRENDENPPEFADYYLFNPRDRVAFVEAQEHVDIYLSIHCNSFEASADVSGMELYYYADNTPLTWDYAQFVGDALVKTFSQDVKITADMEYDEALYVTKAVQMPSILVEVGYVTNPGDAAKMLDDTWKYTMAKALSEGVIDFAESYLVPSDTQA